MASVSQQDFMGHAVSCQVFSGEIAARMTQTDPMPTPSELHALCRDSGQFSPNQLTAIAESRWDRLLYQDWVLLEELSPRYGQSCYRAISPHYANSRELRIIPKASVQSYQSIDSYKQQLHQAKETVHKYLQPIIHIEDYPETILVVLQHRQGSDLQQLIEQIGPMPGHLAADYVRQIALGLAEIHHQGGTHGDVRPRNLFASPLMSRAREDGRIISRPAADATIQLTEYGLVPARPIVPNWPADELDTIAYLPPERSLSHQPTAAGDIYMLAGTLVFLLTGKAPMRGQNLAVLRPDLSASLLDLLAGMLQSLPTARPSVQAVISRLDQEIRPTSPSATPTLSTATASNPGHDLELFDVDPFAESPTVPGNPYPAVNPTGDAFQPAAWPNSPQPDPTTTDWPQASFEFSPQPFQLHETPTEDYSAPISPKRVTTPVGNPRKQLYLWLAVAVVLQLVALGIWVAIFSS